MRPRLQIGSGERQGSGSPPDEATVNQLAEPFSITVQAVSKHLRVLERAGLIIRGRSAQLRPSRLHGEALKEAADWVARDRHFWGRRP
jgi:DNA-binding transcriptional ArsR family regulator